MSVPFTRRGYVAVTITLTSADTNYELLTLVNAILAAETGTSDQVQAPGACRELNIQADGGIDGAAGNTADVLIGDGFLSTTRYGYLLHPGESRNYRGEPGQVIVSGISLRSHTDGQTVHVEIAA